MFYVQGLLKHEISLHIQCLGDIFFIIYSNTLWYQRLSNQFEISILLQHYYLNYQDSEEMSKKGKKSLIILGSAM